MAIYGRDEGGRFLSRAEAIENTGVSDAAAGARAGEEAAQMAQWAATLGKVIKTSAAVHAVKLAKAELVKEYWQSIAPEWDEGKAKGRKPPTGQYHGKGKENYPGDYAKSIEVFEHEDGRVSVGTKLTPLAIWLEYGTPKMGEFACGAKTLAEFHGSGNKTHELFVG